MDALRSDLNSDFTWSTNRVAAGGVTQIFLLVEWRGGIQGPSRHKGMKSHQIAEHVQLDLQLEEPIQLTNVYGGILDSRMGQHITVSIGPLSDNGSKQVVLELLAGPYRSGIYPVITAGWSYRDRDTLQVTNFPSYTLQLQFSNHTDLRSRKPDERVEKALRLLQNPLILDEAEQLFKQGDLEAGESMLRRRADEMMLCALRADDEDYLKEAETLYRLSTLYFGTFSPIDTYKRKVE
ncbi:hypothetical protein MKX64_03445 [Paenibacillus sp. FSL M8-0334]|uniref:Uncharacterized protein n=1 Tax=Paenibacillus campinasensis TaxID=66347 RepID=A0A268EDI7_9BACL|nr:hypothetical protein CHH67_25570 [Paenibacillus campinasensis]